MATFKEIVWPLSDSMQRRLRVLGFCFETSASARADGRTRPRAIRDAPHSGVAPASFSMFSSNSEVVQRTILATTSTVARAPHRRVVVQRYDAVHIQTLRFCD